MAAAWHNYQEEAAAFFRSLGMDAQTNVAVQGVRTSHNVDVLVKAHHVGFEVTWIVECKCWRSAISKLHVLALREIVTDTGSDRGILLSESGFQVGAKEAASLTNVHLRSLSEAKDDAGADVAAMRLVEISDRVQRCKFLYWELPKDLRIAYKLRPDIAEDGYSGRSVLELSEDALLKSFSNAYPFESYDLSRIFNRRVVVLSSAREVVEYLEPLIAELEGKLAACVSALRADHPLRLGNIC